MIITSIQNPKIKNIVRLRKASKRKKQELFLIDGLREIEVALTYNFVIEELFYCPEFDKEKKELKGLKDKIVYITTPAVFRKIAYAENPNGWIAVARPKYNPIEELKLNKNPLIIVLESVEKPGNLGAIIRTAYAANIDAVIINETQTDLYNPNVIKASSGHVFSPMVVMANKEESLAWLKEKKIKIFTTNIKAAKSYNKINWKQAVAIVFGAEADGLSPFWLKEAEQNIIIPMQAGIDSLNVSVSAGIITYEARRQRDLD
jgi:RNA methyltransferase, TrmH family